MEQSNCIYCMNPSKTDICPQCGKHRSEYVSAPHHLMPGTVLNNKYEVGSVLGEGGFGITYIGRDINLDLRVAIKEYFPSGIVNRNNTASAEITAHYGDAQAFFEKGKKSFLGEARTLAKFSNEPSIVSVRDFFSENNTAYIVMEYIEGIDLKDYLVQNGVMTFHQAFSMLSPIMTALSKVHAQGLIHRDISPANIMVMKDGTVKLLDFGAARNVGGTDEKSLSILLKPGYAPEEQYRTKGNQGPWTDVYALSATLYKLVTGTTPDDAMNRIFQDETVKPSSINGEITAAQDSVILKGMAVQQENRYQSVAELQNACQAALVAGKETTYAPDAESTISGDQYFVREQQKVQPTPGTPTPIQPVQNEPKQKEAVSRQTEKTDASNLSASNGKKPNIPCFILSIITGLFALYMFPSFIGSIADSRSQTGTTVVAGIIVLIFAGLTVLFGSKYYPRRNNKEQKPNVFCLVTSIVTTVCAAVCAWMTYLTFANSSAQDGTGESGAAFTISILILTAFFGYFFYPRLEKKKLRKAITIHGGVVGVLAVAFVVYIVFFSLNTITIGDTHIKIDETAVRISYDQVTNNDIAKLKKLKNLESLEIITCFLDDEDVKVIGELTQLQKLFLSGNTDITDVSPLNNLKNLVYLDLSDTKTEDVSCLTNLTGLQKLWLNNTNVSDLSILETYTFLETLGINSLSELDENSLVLPATVKYLHCENNGLESLSFVVGSESLMYLDASGNKISDITPLSKYENIFEVDLSDNNVSDISPVCKSGVNKLMFNNNNISDISSLSGICVSTLELAGNQISDISALADNSNLFHLDLSNNNITDISALKDCFAIYNLDLSHNAIVDISAIATIDKLTMLNLRSNKIVDISPLAEAKALVTTTSILDLRDNEIESVQALSAFVKVSQIYLSNNKISDVSPLASCSALDFLKLNNNNVTDLSPLATLENLSILEVVGNPITDLSAISMNPNGGVFGSSSITHATLRISYNESIDWVALKSVEKLSVSIYGATDRQISILRELGYSSFPSNDLDKDESTSATEESDE